MELGGDTLHHITPRMLDATSPDFHLEDNGRQDSSPEAIWASSDSGKQLLNEGYSHDGAEISKNAALVWAAKGGLLNILKQLLDQGAEIDCKVGPREYTALHWAAAARHCEILAVLSDRGASLEEKDIHGYTALHLAACKGYDDAVLLLVNRGASMQCRDNLGCGPLDHATIENQHGVIRALHSLKADFNAVNYAGLAPVNRACTSRSCTLETLQLLVQLGANIDSKSHNGSTTLHHAARKDKATTVEYFIQAGVDVAATNKLGSTALHDAAESNALSVTRVLLQQNIDVNQKNSHEGMTPLALASQNGCTEIVRLLLEHGADLNLTNDVGDTPLHSAASSNFTETMTFLVENGADIEARNGDEETPLLVAVKGGMINAVRCLADHGANVLAVDKIGFTALHHAVYQEDKYSTRCLLDHGADLEAKTLHGKKTALAIAASEGDTDIVSLLLDAGADVEATDNEGLTPFYRAGLKGSLDVVSALLSHGASPTFEAIHEDRPEALASAREHEITAKTPRSRSPIESQEQAKLRMGSLLVKFAASGNAARVTRLLDQGVEADILDWDGRSAISAAAENDHPDIVDLLIQRGAYVNTRDVHGETALWWASRYGHFGVVQKLLAVDASVLLADEDGQTPLSAAAQGGHDHIIDDLLVNGSDPNAATLYGKTPLFFAETTGNRRVVEMLLKDGANIAYLPPRRSETALNIAKENARKRILGLAQGHVKAFDLVLSQVQNSSIWESPSLEGSNVASTATKKISDSDIQLYSKMLILATMNGRVAEIIRLLRLGADINAAYTSSDSSTVIPIILAAEDGDQLAIETFLKNGAEVDRPDKHGTTALSMAAREGHSLIIMLLALRGSRLDYKDIEQRTPLSHAAENGHDEAVSILVALGARNEVKDINFRTPLWYGVSRGHTKVVTVLLQCGADLECVDSGGMTPLTVAVSNGDCQMCDILLKWGAQMRTDPTTNHSPLSLAAEKGFAFLVDNLINNGASLDYLASNSRTPLMFAAQKGEMAVARILIERGANINLRDDNGRTALSYAKEYRREPIVKLLSQVPSLRYTNGLRTWGLKYEGLSNRTEHQYRPLPDGFIRVLELHPGKQTSVISFDLYDVALDLNPRFEALSYEWKGKFGTVPVQCNQDRVNITPNCSAALYKLRLEARSRTLWIDAICINQKDDEERTRQVAMMTDIYRKAESVLMWIGEEAEHTALAFNSIPRLSQVPQHIDPVKFDPQSPELPDDARRFIDDVGLDELTTAGWGDLSSRSYFTRAWIFQEIVLADSRGILMCGNHSCPWKMFKLAFKGFTVCNGFNKMDMGSHLLHIFWSDDKFPLLPSAAFTMSAFYEAGDKRDKVYAFLGVIMEPWDRRESRMLRADYTKAEQEVFIDASRFLIQEYGRLFLPSCRDSPSGVQLLPSWTMDFTQKKAGLDTEIFKEPRPDYDDFLIARPAIQSVSLHISGCIIDTVTLKVSITRDRETYDIVKAIVHAMNKFGRGIYHIYPGSRGNEAASHNEPDQSVTNEQALLTTLFTSYGDQPIKDIQWAAFLAWKLRRDPDTPKNSKHPPSYLQSSVAAWDAKMRVSKKFSVRDRQPEQSRDIELELCREMEDEHRYERDIVYTEKGLFGLTATTSAEEGMVVALIGGLEHLQLLRKRTSGGDTWYEFVGEVAIYGWTKKNVTKLEHIDANLQITRLEIR